MSREHRVHETPGPEWCEPGRWVESVDSELRYFVGGGVVDSVKGWVEEVRGH